MKTLRKLLKPTKSSLKRTNLAIKNASGSLAKIKKHPSMLETASIDIATLESATQNIVQSLKDIDEARARVTNVKKPMLNDELRNEIKLIGNS